MINRTPEVVRLAIDPDKHLVEVPSPLGKALMMLNALLPYLSGEDGLRCPLNYTPSLAKGAVRSSIPKSRAYRDLR